MAEKIIVTSEFSLLNSPEELNEEDRNLLEEAKKISMNAYAPYSGFFVGAAVLLENGEIITGSNQENAAYPSGLCAERVAIFQAGSKFPGVKIKSLAIVARSLKKKIDEPASPCGACRQSLSEYENLYSNAIRVMMSGETGKVLISASVANLLPLSFTSKNL